MLHRLGYTVLSGVAEKAWRPALKVINEAIFSRGIDPKNIDVHRTFFPELTSHPDILALYETVAPTVERVLEDPLPVTNAQIALRFPTFEVSPPKPHVDGFLGHEWQSHMTALVAVFLSEATASDGALYVWPGSPDKLAHSLKEHGAHGARDFIRGRLPEIFGDPVPICVAPGDAFIGNPMLVHSPGPNSGPFIRYAVFFRVRSRRGDLGYEQLQDPWIGWRRL